MYDVILCFSVDSSLNVKVTDNALAQDLFPNDYVCLGSDDLRPVKWMALECLLHKKYTEATDTVSRSNKISNRSTTDLGLYKTNS